MLEVFVIIGLTPNFDSLRKRCTIYVSVLIDVKTRGLDRPFTYHATPLEGAAPEHIEIGLSCLVNFSGRLVIGYIVEVFETLPAEVNFEVQSIVRYLDGPYFTSDAPQLAQWIAREYGAPLSESMRLFVPPQGKFSIKESDSGAVEVKQKGPRPRYVTSYELTQTGIEYNVPKRSKKMLQVVSALRNGALTRDKLEELVGPCRPQCAQLLAQKLISKHDERVYRGDISFDSRQYVRPEILLPAQENAVLSIDEAARAGQPEVFVLDGVTGSGKTEVYLRAIEKIVARGKTALVLVPEISLTPQTVGRFQARFPDRVAVLHSRLTEAERQDQWERIQEGNASVVVGARSALFAPLFNLGLIVIDEEHDSSYKQGSSPRYHARDVALQKAKQAHIPVVLGSATPSFEALYQCKEGTWRLLTLNERANARPVPQGQIVDLTKEFEAGNRSMFSRELNEALKEVIDRKEKAILMLNRRGSASFLLCRECGYVPQCSDCSTSLTYHERGQHLRCHQCNHIESVPAVCPECGSPYLQQFNAGTQRLESLFRAMYPGVPVVRMDADTTSARNGHQTILDEFAQFEYGVLIGTQMIAKGLDFPEVTLVGVVTADTILNLPDFSAGERTYQLLEQVAGRSGRGAKEGRVIIQTYWPEHKSIVAAAQHNRSLFYNAEAKERLELHNPPYRRLANVIVSSECSDDALHISQELTKNIAEQYPEFEVLGPASCVIERIHKKYRYHVVVKASRDALLGQALGGIAKKLHKKGVSLAVDVDPVSLM